MVGAPWSSARGNRSGRVVIYSGRSLTEDAPRQITAFEESGPGDLLGVSVATLPDYFGPGRGAVVAGAPGVDSLRGVVYFLELRQGR